MVCIDILRSYITPALICHNTFLVSVQLIVPVIVLGTSSRVILNIPILLLGHSSPWLQFAVAPFELQFAPSTLQHKLPTNYTRKTNSDPGLTGCREYTMLTVDRNTTEGLYGTVVEEQSNNKWGFACPQQAVNPARVRCKLCKPPLDWDLYLPAKTNG
ncbi:hypothetical protein EV359DRAFT_88354 [Lentinula novae-zelandiae]|nr:hypothetical protein EV359DRAFT_88354 [Lentinula novae-zelandiae]